MMTGKSNDEGSLEYIMRELYFPISPDCELRVCIYRRYIFA